jgi:hypothetical protein
VEEEWRGKQEPSKNLGDGIKSNRTGKRKRQSCEPKLSTCCTSLNNLRNPIGLKKLTIFDRYELFGYYVHDDMAHLSRFISTVFSYRQMIDLSMLVYICYPPH